MAVARLVATLAPVRLTLAVACVVAVAVSGAGVLVATGWLVQTVSAGGAWLPPLVAFAAATLAVAVFGRVGEGLAGDLTTTVQVHLHHLLVNASLGGTMHDLLWPGRIAKLDAARGSLRDWMTLDGVRSLFFIIQTRLSGAASFIVVLMAWRWWAPIPVVTAWVWYSRRQGAWLESSYDDLLARTGTERRKAEISRSMALNAALAPHLHVARSRDWLGRRMAESYSAAMGPVWENRQHKARLVVLPGLALVITYSLTLLLLVLDASTGKVPSGVVITVALALVRLQLFAALGDAHVAVLRLAKVADAGRELGENAGLPEAGSGTEIVLERVTYTYPGSSAAVLKDVTLRVGPGMRVAVVGPNGAGKSTLLHLMCGQLAPSSGTVVRPASIAILEQEPTRLPWSLRDNISPLDPQTADRVAAHVVPDLVAAAPHGTAQLLGASYENGVDLSGGQWQRVALARALSALPDDRGVLLLDEPSANLDPSAEGAFVTDVLQAAGARTIVMATHRMTAVMATDLVVVLDQGFIREVGSPAQLLAARGMFAEMYERQAARYRS